MAPFPVFFGLVCRDPLLIVFVGLRYFEETHCPSAILTTAALG